MVQAPTDTFLVTDITPAIGVATTILVVALADIVVTVQVETAVVCVASIIA
jgi:hypothetical protein